MFHRYRTTTNEKGTFDPNDTSRVKHTRYGVWDVYEDHSSRVSTMPGSWTLEKYAEMINCLPYIWRMLKDILAIPACTFLFITFCVTQAGVALVPALALWYQGQLLQIMQTAIDTRMVDKDHLFNICTGRIACSVALHLIRTTNEHLERRLEMHIRKWTDAHLFRARARLDVPTFETTSVKRQLEEVTADHEFTPPVPWATLQMLVGFVRAGTQVSAQVWVLAKALSAQHDGWLLAGLTMASKTLGWFADLGLLGGRPQVWAATTNNQDYLRIHGWARAMKDGVHRKEIVAANLGEYAVSECEAASERLGDADNAFKQWRMGSRRSHFDFWSLIQYPLNELPQIIFTLRAVQYPANMPVSLASMQMVREMANTFTWNIYELFMSTESFGDQLETVRKLYEVANVPNKVPDGTVPFPEDTAQIRTGFSLEFRNVSFKYPGAENYALRDVSFSVLPGQLCVIVGANGSGKSTILKLVVRLYDPDEGQILIGGHDIRTLKLRDLRQAISVLFQDYTHFPLSIRDNIAIGDPSAATNEAHVRLAARLGGAAEFIEKLSDGYDTYLDRPVRDFYAGIPEGTTTLFGRKVNYGNLRFAGKLKAADSSELSGGQMQRLAVARTFMRSVVPEEPKVGLLLFDEPSASLDPVAEHDLFNRLRELRGNKTMLFSSHRFGNLTRHADVILYMNDSVIVESGTHEQLLKQGAGYANIWNLQAQAFL
ncbi:P-loop containing nucleoside triphosphate hydrolase protein [Trametes coccinea BRFM310]|uniref:p-loop containing nucleoside triphosphate hydrolase protein n=1 Tax=Trametes coccinea (strain BRFM310) TaxID=1353009 RepID=A0A1Y2IWU9_TRAC3|nr:P-loop containing nucleoside triphosphate hydrolase protein [Trametes coccinea BRFM310]